MFLTTAPTGVAQKIDPVLVNELNKATVPIVELIQGGTKALLIVFCAAMSILAIINSFGFAKAEDPQQKTVAKQKINNLIIAFGMAFALLVLFSFLDDTLTNWVAQYIVDFK